MRKIIRKLRSVSSFFFGRMSHVSLSGDDSRIVMMLFHVYHYYFLTSHPPTPHPIPVRIPPTLPPDPSPSPAPSPSPSPIPSCPNAYININANLSNDDFLSNIDELGDFDWTQLSSSCQAQNLKILKHDPQRGIKVRTNYKKSQVVTGYPGVIVDSQGASPLDNEELYMKYSKKVKLLGARPNTRNVYFIIPSPKDITYYRNLSSKTQGDSKDLDPISICRGHEIRVTHRNTDANVQLITYSTAVQRKLESLVKNKACIPYGIIIATKEIKAGQEIMFAARHVKSFSPRAKSFAGRKPLKKFQTDELQSLIHDHDQLLTSNWKTYAMAVQKERLLIKTIKNKGRGVCVTKVGYKIDDVITGFPGLFRSNKPNPQSVSYYYILTTARDSLTKKMTDVEYIVPTTDMIKNPKLPAIGHIINHSNSPNVKFYPLSGKSYKILLPHLISNGFIGKDDVTHYKPSHQNPPNGYGFIIAIRDIQVNQELLVNYGNSYNTTQFVG